MSIRRIIESSIGHRIGIEITADGRAIEICRQDLKDAEPVRLEARAARILSAYLSSALILDRATSQPERIGEVAISMHSTPAPVVRVTRGKRGIDLHAPGWQALHFEIDLLTPRLTGDEA